MASVILVARAGDQYSDNGIKHLSDITRPGIKNLLGISDAGIKNAGIRHHQPIYWRLDFLCHYHCTGIARHKKHA